MNEELHIIKEKYLPEVETDKNKSFFSFIKNSDKIRDLIENFGLEAEFNPVLFFSQNEEMFPKKIEIKNRIVNHKRIDLANLQMGDKYIKLISSSFRKQVFKNLRQIVLSRNKLSDMGLRHLLENLPAKVTELVLQDNLISPYGCVLLENHMQVAMAKLQIGESYFS